MPAKTARPLSGADIISALQGRVQAGVLNGDISLTAESGGKKRHFVVDHGFEALDTLLIVKQGDQIRLKLSSAWPIAVIVELSLVGRKPGSHQDERQVIAAADLLLPSAGGQAVVVVDRWKGGANRALQAARASSVEMLGGIAVAGPAPRYTLTVTPVQSAVAAGMLWNWDSAELPWNDVLAFDAMLRRFPPWTKVHDPLSLERFQQLRSDLERIVKRLDDTEARLAHVEGAPAIGGHRAAAPQPAYPGQIIDSTDPGDAPAPVYPGQIAGPPDGAAGSPPAELAEMLGGFVRGDALPAKTGLAFVPRSLGAARTFDFGVLVCSSEDQLGAFATAAGSDRR